MEVSEIGLGTWGLGGEAYGPVAEKTALRALETACDWGINFFDTAPLYGEGRSEILVGKVLANKRDRAVIATKGGMLPGGDDPLNLPRDYSVEGLRSSLEGSLRRLGTDYVDLFQLHSPALDEIGNWPEVIALLEMLKTEGKLRAYGISLQGPGDGPGAIKVLGFRNLQVNFNLIDQRAARMGLLDLAAETGTGIIARTPLAFGYLSGTLGGSETLSALDHRRNWSRKQLEIWASAPKLFDDLMTGGCRTHVQLALQFCLSRNEIATTIPGMVHPDQVIENAKSVDLPPLSREELALIENIYAANTFYSRQ